MFVTDTRDILQPRGDLLTMVWRLMALLLAALGVLLALAPARVLAEENQLEQVNRAVYDFNQKYISGSASSASQFFIQGVPSGLRQGVSNFFSNLGEPVIAVSSLALGDMDNASIATHRFFYNLVFGFGGVFDRATEIGVKSVPRDVGQAVCSSGIPDGPYLVLPFYGSSTVGDLFGSALPILAGYVALGEAYWVYRASSKVAATLGTPDGTNAMAAQTAARLDETYRLDKEKYLAAREAACGKHAPPPSSGSGRGEPR